MALFALFEDFGSNVIRSSAEGRAANGVHVAARYQQRRQAKVANLCIHVRVEEDVAHFQVSVNNAFAVHVLDSAGNLHRVETDLGLGKALSALDHVHERAVGTQLEDEIGAIVEGKGSEKLDDVLVAHFRVYLQFRLKLINNVSMPVFMARQVCHLLFAPSWEAYGS